MKTVLKWFPVGLLLGVIVSLAILGQAPTFGPALNGIANGGTPGGPAGGDLSGTYPNPTVAKVNGNAPGGTCTNQFARSLNSSAVPTCATVQNADMANPSTNVNGQTCTLGASCTISGAPTGIAGGDLSGTYPNPGVAKVNGNTPGGTCTNQFTRSLDSSARPTCATVQNADLNSPTITINSTSCTLGASCSPPGSGNTSPTGTFYLTPDGGTTFYGPIFQLTPPNVISYSWRNQGTATETAVGNALVLSTTAISGDQLRGREIVLPATPVSITTMQNCALVSITTGSSFPSCGVYFADNGTGRITTLGILISGTNQMQISVGHFTNATTFSATAAQAFIYTPSTVTLKIQDTGTNHVFFYSVDGGNSFVQIFTESRTAWLATPNRVGYHIDSNNATWSVNDTLLSWKQGT